MKNVLALALVLLCTGNAFANQFIKSAGGILIPVNTVERSGAKTVKELSGYEIKEFAGSKVVIAKTKLILPEDSAKIQIIKTRKPTGVK